eukprot:3872495-Amphidinium_carterae.1
MRLGEQCPVASSACDCAEDHGHRQECSRAGWMYGLQPRFSTCASSCSQDLHPCAYGSRA